MADDKTPAELKVAAEKKWQEAKSRRSQVSALAAAWKEIREANHFAESFRIALGGRP